MPPGHIRQRRPQRRGIQVPGQPHRHRDVVRRARPLQLRQEPQPLLRERQRHPARPLPRPQRRPRRAAPPARAASPAGVGASNTARTASSAPSTARTRLTSRTASSECPPRSKKLSSAPTRSSPSTSANTPHKISSSHRRRTPARAAPRRVIRGGQRRPVHLPVRRQRQPIQHHHRRRHHVLRQPPRRVLPHRPGQPATPVTVGGSAAGRDHVSHQPLVTGGVLPGGHHGLRHPRVSRPAPPPPHPARPGTRGS